MTRKVFIDVVDNSNLHSYHQLDPDKKIEIYRCAIMLRRNGLGYKRIKRLIEKDFNIKIGLTTIRNWFNKNTTPMGLGSLVRDIMDSPVNKKLMGRNYEELNAYERLNLRNEALRLHTKGCGPYKVRKILRLKYGIDIPRGAITGWIYRSSLPQGRKKIDPTDSNLAIPAALSISDGSIYKGKRGALSFQMKDKDPADFFVERLRELTDRISYKVGYDKKKSVYYKRIYRKDLVNFLSNQENIISLLNSNPKEFIRAYFECEGGPCGSIKMNKKSRTVEFESMIVVTNTNERVLDVVREKLAEMGIHATKKVQVRRGRKTIIRGKEAITKKDCYALVICRKDSIIKFYEMIGFISRRKQEKLKDIVNILTRYRTKESRAIQWIRLYEPRRSGKEKWVKRMKPLTLKEAKKALKKLYPSFSPPLPSFPVLP